MRRTARALVVTFVVLVASGCAGKAGPAAPTESQDPNTLPEGVTNILEGTVQGVDFYPIENATMRISGLEDNTTTDDAGYFRFESLPPRDYIITATKEGYRPKSQRAIIEDEKIFQLDFVMEQIPNEAPYNTTVPRNGRISCQFAYQTTPDNTQRPQCTLPANLDPTNNQAHLFDVNPGAAQILVEISWSQGSSLAKELTVTVESLGDNAVQFAYDTGEHPLRTVVSQSLLRQNMRDGNPMKVQVTVEAAPSLTGDEAATDVGLAFQQAFTIYFTVFFIEPGPTNYSAVPKP